MQERITNFSKATTNTNYPEEIKEYLKGTTHVPVTSSLQKYVKDIVKTLNLLFKKHKPFMIGQLQLCTEMKM